MANWFYYNEKGEKISVTGGQLKGLAKAGVITPETIIETEDGKTAPARKVKGLTFGEAIPPQSSLPTPPATPNPFSAAPPASSDPFDAFNEAIRDNVTSPHSSTSSSQQASGKTKYPSVPEYRLDSQGNVLEVYRDKVVLTRAYQELIWTLFILYPACLK